MMIKKMKLFLSMLTILIFLFSVAPVVSPTNGGNPKDNVKEDIERIDFVHYAKQTAKGKPSAATCYKLLGVKWTSLPVNYAINPTNSQNIPSDFITSAISTAAETWDSQTSKELFNNAYLVDYFAGYGIRDSKNAITFGQLSNTNIIAVTSIWYSKRAKQIVEFDMQFNTYYSWGNASTDSTIMDLQNIATHELGHGIGLDDIYTSSCDTVTMYGYSDNGDIEKRTLAEPDIKGLMSMYGQ